MEHEIARPRWIDVYVSRDRELRHILLAWENIADFVPSAWTDEDDDDLRRRILYFRQESICGRIGAWNIFSIRWVYYVSVDIVEIAGIITDESRCR